MLLVGRIPAVASVRKRVAGRGRAVRCKLCQNAKHLQALVRAPASRRTKPQLLKLFCHKLSAAVPYAENRYPKR
jgi:hypothetical protein